MEVKKFLRIMKLRKRIDTTLAVVARNAEACGTDMDRLSGELALKATDRLTDLLKQLIEELENK